MMWKESSFHKTHGSGCTVQLAFDVSMSKQRALSFKATFRTCLCIFSTL